MDEKTQQTPWRLVLPNGAQVEVLEVVPPGHVSRSELVAEAARLRGDLDGMWSIARTIQQRFEQATKEWQVERDALRAEVERLKAEAKP